MIKNNPLTTILFIVTLSLVLYIAKLVSDQQDMYDLHDTEVQSMRLQYCGDEWDMVEQYKNDRINLISELKETVEPELNGEETNADELRMKIADIEKLSWETRQHISNCDKF